MTFSDSLLSSGTRKRRKKQLSYLLRSGVVWEQQKKSCQTRCKVVKPGERGQEWRGDWEGKVSLMCGTSFDAIDLWLAWSTAFLFTSASLLILSLNGRNYCKSWQRRVTLFRYFDVLELWLLMLEELLPSLLEQTMLLQRWERNAPV